MATQPSKRKSSYVGYGIVLGVVLGPVVWGLLMDGDTITGAGIGIGLGIVIGAIAEELGRIPLYSFIGIGLGAAGGPILGVIIGMLHAVYQIHAGTPPVDSFLGLPYQDGYIRMSILSLSAIGMMVGTVVETRMQPAAQE